MNNDTKLKADMYPGIEFSPVTETAMDILATDKSISVEDIGVFPPAPNYATFTDGEKHETVVYRTIEDGMLCGVERGVEGAARDWPVGTRVARLFTNRDHQAFIDNFEWVRDQLEDIFNADIADLPAEKLQRLRAVMGLGDTLGALPVVSGGTGAETVGQARVNLGVNNAANITEGVLPIPRGGTGASVVTGATGVINQLFPSDRASDATIFYAGTNSHNATGWLTMARARERLGLGNTTAALPVANGGTGATTIAAARTNLGITAADFAEVTVNGVHFARFGRICVARVTTPHSVTNMGVTLLGANAVPVGYRPNRVIQQQCSTDVWATLTANFSIVLTNSFGSGSRSVPANMTIFVYTTA